MGPLVNRGNGIVLKERSKRLTVELSRIDLHKLFASLSDFDIDVILEGFIMIATEAASKGPDADLWVDLIKAFRYMKALQLG